MKFNNIKDRLLYLGAEFKHMEKARDLISKLKEFEAEIAAILDKKIEDFLVDFKDTEHPLLIYVQGYTPSWNDGEACEHWAQSGVGIKELLYEELLLHNDDFFGEYVTNLDDLDYNSEEEDVEGTFAQPTEEIKEVVKELIMPALDKKYGTDYRALVVCHKGTVTIKSEDWNPEW